MLLRERLRREAGIYYNQAKMNWQTRVDQLFKSKWSRALMPGLHIKRWLLLILVGVVVAGLGLAFLLRDLIAMRQLLPLTYVPDWVRGVLLLAVGLLVTFVAVWFLNRAVVNTVVADTSSLNHRQLASRLLNRSQRRQGPKIVAIGGGTGMPLLLRGLRDYTDNLTAIVTVADDGGSSGVLRRQTGMLPPGDFRNNIAALSESENLMHRVFQYRFAERELDGGETASHALAGHSFGNLFITTMAAVTGSFETGIAESSRVLAVRGRVLPSTLENICLCAEVGLTMPDGHEEWTVIEGESNIPKHGGRIVRVFLKPEQPRAYPATIQAILQADLIVAGPGSFFTSVLPNLLVPAIRDAICAASAPRIYVCNVATQAGETDGYSVSDHMRQLRMLTGDTFPIVLANQNYDPATPPSPHSDWVTLPTPNEELNYQIFAGDLVDPQRPWRHDARKLAGRLMQVYDHLQGASSTSRGAVKVRQP